MKTRVLSGLIMLPLLVVVFINGYVLYAAAFIIALMAVKEFYNGFKAIGIRTSYPVAVVATVCLFSMGIANDVWLRMDGEMSRGWIDILARSGDKLYLLWFFGCMSVCMLYMFRVKEIKMGRCNGNSCEHILHCILQLPYRSYLTRSGDEYNGLVRYYFSVRNGYNGLLFRLSVRQTQAVSEYQP